MDLPKDRQAFTEPPPKYTPTSSQPPPQPYPPAPTQPYVTTQQTTTIIHQPRIVQQVVLGDYPVQVTCPRGHVVTTRVRHEPGTQTWMVALFLCLFLGPLCALIPFCMEDMQDAVHECPIDGTVIGVSQKGC